jgi:AraC-like DNA-binding protein
MKYQQIPPPAHLKAYVRHFWTLDSTGADLSPKAFGPLADGYPGLIFQQSLGGRLLDQYSKLLPEGFVYGQTITRTALYLEGSFRLIGVCFFPNVLRSIWGFQADEVTDTCLGLEELSKKKFESLSEQLFGAPSIPLQIEKLSAYLTSQINVNQSPLDQTADYALSRILNTRGSVSLRELQQHLQLSERSLERRFKQTVGISPKLYARICRFQAALQQLKSQQYTLLSDVAYDNGYADQSHFIRTFKEFAGYSPYQFQRQSFDVSHTFTLSIIEKNEAPRLTATLEKQAEAMANFAR